MSPGVSVVVPTCGRPDLLRRCVAALEAQSLAADAYEIIVVDDTLARRGPAATRNIGWRRAKAPIVAFTDDDTVPDADWLARGLAAFEPGVDAVAGRIVMPLPATPTDYERNEQGLERAEFVTANCFVRRGVLQRLGGFDESFRLPWREDSDLHFRLLEAGCRVVLAPQAIVVHPVRPAFLSVRQCLYRLRDKSKAPAHVAEMVFTLILIPPLAVFWRLVGALKFRVAFVLRRNLRGGR